MGGTTPTEKVHELSKIVATLSAGVDALRAELKGVAAEQSKSTDGLTHFKTNLAVLEQRLIELKSRNDSFGSLEDLKVKLALIGKDIEELKKWQEDARKQKDEWGRRLWALAGPVLAAITGVLLGYYLRGS
jgi:chromosome segregation ATPase